MTISEYQKRRRIALAGLILLAFLILLTIGSAWNPAGHEAVEAVGLAAIMVGILGRVWCTLYIGGRKNEEIVREGPYSMVRNPLYVFSTIAAAGVGAQTGSILVAILFMAACALAFSVVIDREERHLTELFGEGYKDYRSSVPRFLPDPRLFSDRPLLTAPAGRIYRTLGDGLMFLAAIPAFELVEHLQAVSGLPVLLRLY